MNPDDPNPTLDPEPAVFKAIASAQRRPESKDDEWLSFCQQGEARTVVREVGPVKVTRTVDRRSLPQGDA